jgi:hypothetical protein
MVANPFAEGTGAGLGRIDTVGVNNYYRSFGITNLM